MTTLVTAPVHTRPALDSWEARVLGAPLPARVAPAGAVSPRQAFQEVLHGYAGVLDLRPPSRRRVEGELGLGRVSAVAGPRLADVHVDPTQRWLVLSSTGRTAAAVARDLRDGGVDALAVTGGVRGWRRTGLPLRVGVH
ncbi:hypothetical protein GC722_14435 [Auraticoccus sp. F435]|uniref:Rhodanese domain-containing protein n=1 Tax=Auraticoccus cholistanensis TaxID=2656650 RepID=A0A6A9UZ33_9ACTN|nr:hypothetical protein [Auraticoccus cholistanensis]MVA77212.1 hypothetical protein [Auraticoccus cholistanensis]